MKLTIVLWVLSGMMWAHSVTLYWVAPVSSPVKVVGYHVYRTTDPLLPYSQVSMGLVTNLNFKDTLVSSGMTYYYVVRSVSQFGDESVNSNRVQAYLPPKPGKATNLVFKIVDP